MLNGTQLRKLFQEFNVRYFDGGLPAYRIRVVGYRFTAARRVGCRSKIKQELPSIEIRASGVGRSIEIQQVVKYFSRTNKQ